MAGAKAQRRRLCVCGDEFMGSALASFVVLVGSYRLIKLSFEPRGHH